MNRRHQIALGLWAASVAAFWTPIAQLVALASEDARYSYILLVPVISGFLLVLRKREFLNDARYAPYGGALIGGVAAGLSAAGFSIAGMLVAWTAIALACYGTQAVRRARFPLAFLALAIPPSAAAMDQLVVALQTASADTTAGLFHLTGITFQREGFTFSLSTVIIEVAKECSGVRSFTSMLIGAILAAHLLLRNGWNQAGFALLTIPVAIFKNAVRITGITWLGLNVDEGFFSGELHRYSGIPFSLVALAILVPVLLALRKMERGPLEIDSLGVRQDQVMVDR